MQQYFGILAALAAYYLVHEGAHLLYALLTQPDGLVGEVMRSVGASPEDMIAELDRLIAQFPKAGGSGYDPSRIYISASLDKALTEAEKQAGKMKDDYISVEHVLLGILEYPTDNVKALFRAQNVTAAAVLEALRKFNRESGVTVVMISSELEELRMICDRIAIVSGGKIAGILPADHSSEEFGMLMVSQVK